VRDEPDRAALARQALARAKADAKARGISPASANNQPAERAVSPGADARARAARRRRNDDPLPLAAAIEGLIGDNGWALAAATGSVFGRWPQIVGAELAAHTVPESLSEGELTISADSTAWATQVRLLAGQLVHRLNAELGDGVVHRVKVRGPVTVQRRPGEWRVRGSRGPRDTYG
jgi:predicted nucleic acid-binding Zn ribbon protein